MLRSRTVCVNEYCQAKLYLYRHFVDRGSPFGRAVVYPLLDTSVYLRPYETRFCPCSGYCSCVP